MFLFVQVRLTFRAAGAIASSFRWEMMEAVLAVVRAVVIKEYTRETGWGVQKKKKNRGPPKTEALVAGLLNLATRKEYAQV